MQQIGKMLVIVGVSIVAIGIILWAVSSLNIKGIPFGRLPGDIYIKRDNFVFYAPIVSFLLLSVFLTIIINVIVRIFFH